ncbi:MAG: HNH endonuclease [Capsulimonadales bacterium]|nr:HNH endonuclease [Capsulimonadales bacterium]
MRPLHIGPIPRDVDGEPIVFREYQEARPHLQERIGFYCVFCERRIPTGLAVEHKQPKALPAYQHRRLDWFNFVLACSNCNATKGTTDTGADTFLFPDEVNTAHAFRYLETNEIVPNPFLSPDEQAAVERTLRMVGLYLTDRRFIERGQAWEKAKRYKAKVLAKNDSEQWDTVVDLAEATGFWSVWMTIFADHPEVRRLLIRRFVGTHPLCFDDEGVCRSQLRL